MQLIDAQRAGEELQDQAAVGAQVQARHLPAEAVVDEAVGQRHQEVAPHCGLGLLDVEAVAQQAIEDRLSNGGVVVGLGGHVQGPGAEILAAATAAAVLCVGDLQPGDPAVCQGADAAVQEAFAVALAATGGARGTPGGRTNPVDQVGEHGLCPRQGDAVSTALLGRRPSILQVQKELRSLSR